MERNNRLLPILYALIAAVFYALNMPVSKGLLAHVAPTFMAAFLYLGAGVGMAAIYLLGGRRDHSEKLTQADLPYTIGIVVLDIIAPILLMAGLTIATAANASLLNNFEIVATSLIALVLFREKVSGRLWAGIGLITLSSILLTTEGSGSLSFSTGSLLVLAATCCWGLENNCTRRISEKNTYEIVMIKGIFSGLGALIVALILGEPFAPLRYGLAAMALGFVAYGLSIFFYIRAQKKLGAAKTSAYYAAAPFVGALLSLLLLREPLSRTYFAALAVMAAGSALVVVDTLLLRHTHLHTHTITHTHDGSTHTHVFTHEHGHIHMLSTEGYPHTHSMEETHGAAPKAS